PQVIYQWGEKPPMSRQYELEVKTEGTLKADRNDNQS
ncbi:DNA-binding transcriptional regulator Cro, partial [uncultured Caudovirales phage]